MNSWDINETLGMALPNPRSVSAIPKPENMTQQEFEAFAKELEKRLFEEI